MDDAPTASNDRREAERLAALRGLDVLDGVVNPPALARVVRLAAKLFDAPKAAIALVDETRIWRVAYQGYTGPEGPRRGDLADRVVAANAPIDLAAPIRDGEGRPLGALVLEGPGMGGPASDDDLQALADLADLAAETLCGPCSRAPTLESERLDLAIAAASLGEFEWNIQENVFKISPRLAKLSGIPVGEMADQGGDSLYPYVHPDDRDAVRASVDAQLAEDGRFTVEYRRLAPDGAGAVWNSAAGVMLRDADGRPARLIGVVQDITERKLQEEQRESLVAELDHRIKNLLAVVQSVAAQSARKSASLDVFLKTFAARLKSMSSAHDLLSAARWRGATLARIAAAELGGLAPTQTRWDGPELFLTPRAASALSLALHELATNAVKFGALSVETGHVDVRWTAKPSGGFELTWTESGGPTVSAPVRRGFGSTLLEQVTPRELNGDVKVDYRPAGVTVSLTAGPQAVAERPEVVPEVSATRVTETVPTSRGPTSLKGARVLIVEDAVLLALELETGLSDAGAVVVGPAYELEEAMALLDRPIDAAVLDANLNGHSVTPVAEVLFQRKIPFVFATGYGETGGAPGGFDAPVIRKPYDVTQVAAAVAELLAQR